MQRVVFEDPYRFIPPHRGRLWPDFIQLWLDGYLARAFGVVEVECRGVEHVRRSIDAGHGILLAPNHSRTADPMVLGIFSRKIKRHLYAMASWHLFKHSRFQSFMIRRMGGFSIYREGADRAAVNEAVDALVNAERPLVIFPEGVTTGSNDLVYPLLDGPAFIARTAAKRRAKAGARGGVVVHPVAIRHTFEGDVEATLAPIVAELEARLTWRPHPERPLAQRVLEVQLALLELKERAHLGAPQRGDVQQRLTRLIEQLLAPVEQEWNGGPNEDHVVARVKKLRAAMLPDMIARKVTAEENARRWRQLADLYLAQQLAFYPPAYCHELTPDRLVETVLRLDEDINDDARVIRPWKTVIEAAPAIEVPADAGRSYDEQLSSEISRTLQSMLDASRRRQTPLATGC
ncbi:MAG: 1-acyl-sn-glycerol-3-phosphate acyltransferase [Pirellulales bacterium]